VPLEPSNFDGAPIRHTLYTLALTHFQPIYHNYFERPQLHTLQNRSGERWSPLIALAALFEEVGQVPGLLETITSAADTDQQLSEGKALSDREEAVLQALELMTQGADGEVWVKASQLREQVGQLLGNSADQVGHAQWIGHILNRLHLIDASRRQRDMQGQGYRVSRQEIVETLRRYDIPPIGKTLD
jgi:hypothetical protein